MADLFTADEAKPAPQASSMAGVRRISLHSEMEIYRAVTDLTRHAIKVEQNMWRKAKPKLGAILIDETLWMGVLILKANKTRAPEAKVPLFEEILEQLEIVEITLRHARELKFVPPSAMGDAIPLLAAVGKQATALRNHFAPAS